jgi:hypothetical protein
MNADRATGPAPASPASTVSVDRVVVEGLSLAPAQALGFRRALEVELARSFASGEPLSPGAVPSCRAAPVELGARWKPSDLAREVAARVRDALREGR